MLAILPSSSWLTTTALGGTSHSENARFSGRCVGPGPPSSSWLCDSSRTSDSGSTITGLPGTRPPDLLKNDAAPALGMASSVGSLAMGWKALGMLSSCCALDCVRSGRRKEVISLSQTNRKKRRKTTTKRWVPTSRERACSTVKRMIA